MTDNLSGRSTKEKTTDRRIRFLALCFLALTSTVSADQIVYVEGAPDPFVGHIYTGTEDTMLVTNLGGQQDENFGQSLVLEAGAAFPEYPESDGRRHALIRFDVTSLAGQYHRINSVTLRLTSDFANGSGTVQAFPLTQANANWIEGTGAYPATGESTTGESTWNQKLHKVENWAGSAGASTPGTDYLNSPVASQTFDGTQYTLDFMFTDPTIVEGWVSGTNSGLLLKTESEINGNRFGFNSSEASYVTLRPQLIIDYDPIIDVAIDIKPGSEPNSINLGSKGVIPVAILSSSTFDALTVDTNTVFLAGATVAVRGKADKSLVSVEDVNGDGLDDLVLQVETENLDPGQLQSGLAVLIGETITGEGIQGEDTINIVPQD